MEPKGHAAPTAPVLIGPTEPPVLRVARSNQPEPVHPILEHARE